MCMIIGKKSGVEHPSLERLEHCSRGNNDGIGIAYTSRGSIQIRKDFVSHSQLYDWVSNNVPVSEAYLIHFRKGTSGLKDEGNRQPFPVTRKNKRLRASKAQTDMAIAHNGTLTQLSNHKKYSDTLLFVKNILSDPIIKNNIHTGSIQELILGYLDGSRMAILTRLGEIIQFGNFYAHEGLIFSNTGFKPTEYLCKTYSGYQLPEYMRRSSNGENEYQCETCRFYFHWKEITWVNGTRYCDKCRFGEKEARIQEVLRKIEEDERRLIPIININNNSNSNEDNNRKGDDNA